MRKSKILLACFIGLLLIHSQVRSQDSLAGSYIDITKVQLAKSIGRSVSTAYVDNDEDWKKRYDTISFTPGYVHRGTVPNNFVMKRLLMKFRISNSADTTESVYFFPGFYYNEIQLYREKQGAVQSLDTALPRHSDSLGYRLLSLAPHDSATIVAELRFLKTYINTIRPRLINKNYVDGFIAEMHTTNAENDLVTYVFCGLLLMMILYSFANFVQGANPEFLYYSGYAFFLGLMLFTKAALNYHTTRLSFFAEEYLDFIMQGLGIMFYMIFMQKFLDTKNLYKFLHRLYNSGIVILVISMVSYTFFHYFTANYSVEYWIEFVTKILLLLMILVFLVYSFSQRSERLLWYLFWGNLFLFIFALLSQIFIITRPQFKGLPPLFNSSLFYYEIGLLLELVFFLAGLNHKNRRNIIEQTKETERLKADNLM
jgi:hypothetical protein